MLRLHDALQPLHFGARLVLLGPLEQLVLVLFLVVPLLALDGLVLDGIGRPRVLVLSDDGRGLVRGLVGHGLIGHGLIGSAHLSPNCFQKS